MQMRSEASAASAASASASASASACRVQGNTSARIISLSEAHVASHQRCAAGAHIIFIGTVHMASMTMRGSLMASMLNQSFAHHGARSSYILVPAPTNTTAFSELLEGHFDAIGGRPAACVILKYSVRWMGEACRRRGALVVVDSIDNYRAFSHAMLSNEHYREMDAVAVQTEAHADILARWNFTAVLLPHPHGNVGAWSVSTETRPSLGGLGVGFVWSDPHSLPSAADMRSISQGVCRANASLYFISSGPSGLRVSPYRVNCTEGTVDGAHPPLVDPWLNAAAAGHGACAHRHEHTQHRGSRNASRSPREVADDTHQRAYYESERLLELIDVGIVWRPGSQKGGHIAVSNRPPTRLHWWWSHHIPTIGYPMEAYLDAARRVDYPTWLLNLTTADQIESTLRRLAPADERSCLQRAAAHGARVSSPWHAALQTLAAICTLAERCGRPLQRAETAIR